MPKQMRVGEFMSIWVEQKYKSKFIVLMYLWEGEVSVEEAFYDIDVLQARLEEAQESIEGRARL